MALRNVTVSLEETFLRKARVMAAEEDKSLSAFLADLLRERVLQNSRYQEAMRSFLRQRPVLSTGGRPLPKRDELYGRGLLHRR